MRHKTTITLLGAFLATSTILAAESKGQFIDANTYETVVQGKSSGKGSPAMQESQCAQGALLSAQHNILLDLSDYGWSNIKGEVNRTEFENGFTQEMRGTIRGVQVMKRKYDASTRRCELTVRVQNEGLQTKAQEAAIKAANRVKKSGAAAVVPPT
jgi:hypothetical protein